jgi:dolichol-phosphate mannosyltransferase
VDQRPRPLPGRLPGLGAALRHRSHAARDLRAERRVLVGRGLKLSVVIPAHNEAGSIVGTLERSAAALEEAGIEYELIVVDDASSDDTARLVEGLAAANPRVRYLLSRSPRGFGLAVREGLDAFTGDAVCVMMADASDSPADLVTYQRLLESGYDCAFGSRFIRGSEVHGYPRFKLALNRAANAFIRMIFRHGYNDTTNAFKAYRREVIETVQPLLSNHFNLTVELPLKAIVRGHSYGVVPISWTNRSEGVSKLKLQEMGSRYLFIVAYVFLEHHLSRGDYRRAGSTRQQRLRPGLPGTAQNRRAPG